MTKALSQLKQLEEEDPLLHIVWNSRLEEIQMQLMGEVQTEVLRALSQSAIRWRYLRSGANHVQGDHPHCGDRSGPL